MGGRAVLLAVVAVVAVVGAVWLAASSARREPLDPLVIDNGTEPQSLDPTLMRGVPEHRLALALFEGLCGYDPKTLAPVPGVAERWELSEDARTYTFYLRDCRWSDGEPVTAEDFVYAYRRILDPATAADYAHMVADHLHHGRAYHRWALAEGALSLLGRKRLDDPARAKNLETLGGACADQAGRIRALTPAGPGERERLEALAEEAGNRPTPRLEDVGVRALDARTLQVELEHPAPYFPEMTGHYAFFPVPRRAVERHGERWTRPDHFVGNGPYRLRQHEPQSHILLERNPLYWDAARVPQRDVMFLPTEQASTTFLMYEGRSLHWMTDVPRDFIGRLEGRPDYHSDLYAGTYFYGFNVTRPGLEKKLVRQALAWAVDRAEITRFITQSGEQPAGALVPPMFQGYEAPPGYGFDPERARRLLAEAGHPGGRDLPPVELIYNTKEVHEKIAAAIQQMWKKHLGIDVKLRNLEWGTYLSTMSKIDFELIRRAWIGDYNDPNTFLEMFVTGGGNNNTHWSNAEYDRIILKEAPVERDPARRFALLRRAEEILLEEAPILPVYYYVSHNMYRSELQGVHPTLLDIHPLHRVVRASGHAP